jgi:hypothetical protein
MMVKSRPQPNQQENRKDARGDQRPPQDAANHTPEGFPASARFGGFSAFLLHS